jgi:hypothetical protein
MIIKHGETYINKETFVIKRIEIDNIDNLKTSVCRTKVFHCHKRQTHVHTQMYTYLQIVQEGQCSQCGSYLLLQPLNNSCNRKVW